MKKILCSILVVLLVLSLTIGVSSGAQNSPYPVIDSPGAIGNMVPAIDKSTWITWQPHDGIKPSFSIGTFNNESVLKISSGGKYENYGRWMCNVKNVKAGSTYRFSVEYLPDNISKEDTSVVAMYSWLSSAGKVLGRYYADSKYMTKDGWKGLMRVLKAPNFATTVRIELNLRWTGGSIQWRRPVFTKTMPTNHRTVKVASVQVQARYSTKQENLNQIIKMIDETGKKEHPDIMCLAESLYDFETKPNTVDARSETIPGPLTNTISRKAKEYKCYLVFSMVEKEGNQYHQTAVLIDRGGQIAGKYRKVHVPLDEAEFGYTPGTEYPVFQTDFGKIGMMICWDQWFPETARILTANGAEVIFVPTMGMAPIQAQARAADNGIYIVVSDYLRPENTKIIDPEGTVIAHAPGSAGQTGYAVSTIDLDKTNYSMGDVHSVYLKERRMDTYDRLLGD